MSRRCGPSAEPSNIDRARIDPGTKASKIILEMTGGVQGLRRTLAGPGGMSDALQEVLRGIFANNNVAVRNAELNQLLGRGWQTNVETLKLLATEGYGPLIDAAKKAGTYFGPEEARRAQEFTISLNHMQTQLEGMAVSLGKDLLPEMLKLIPQVEVFKDKVAELYHTLEAAWDWTNLTKQGFADAHKDWQQALDDRAKATTAVSDFTSEVNKEIEGLEDQVKAQDAANAAMDTGTKSAEAMADEQQRVIDLWKQFQKDIAG